MKPPMKEPTPLHTVRHACQPDNNPALELYGDDFVVDPKTGAFSCWLRVPVRAL